MYVITMCPSIERGERHASRNKYGESVNMLVLDGSFNAKKDADDMVVQLEQDVQWDNFSFDVHELCPIDCITSAKEVNRQLDLFNS